MVEEPAENAEVRAFKDELINKSILFITEAYAPFYFLKIM